MSCPSGRSGKAGAGQGRALPATSTRKTCAARSRSARPRAHRRTGEARHRQRGKAPSSGKGERYLVRVKKRDYINADGVRTNPLMTANLLEYGSSHQPATPFARPTVEQNGEATIRIVTEDLVKRVDKVAQQLRPGQGALMFPNVYETLRANATVLSLVGENIGRHGSLQQSVQPPYITWSRHRPAGRPDQRSADTDFDTIQIDCWSKDDAQVATLARRARCADAAGRREPGRGRPENPIPSCTASASTPTSSPTADRGHHVPPPGPLRAFFCPKEGIRHVRKRQNPRFEAVPRRRRQAPAIPPSSRWNARPASKGWAARPISLDDTCLDDTDDKSFVRGLGNPGQEPSPCPST